MNRVRYRGNHSILRLPGVDLSRFDNWPAPRWWKLTEVGGWVAWKLGWEPEASA